MNAIKTKSLVVSLIALVLSSVAAPAALAEETMYPGSSCSFANWGVAGKGDNKGAAFLVPHSRFQDRSVTCPVPINIPRGLQATQVSYTVNVYVSDGRRAPPTVCRLRKVNVDGTDIPSNSQQTPGLANNAILSFQSVSFRLPLRERAVLTCWLQYGSRIKGYSVTTADF